MTVEVKHYEPFHLTWYGRTVKSILILLAQKNDSYYVACLLCTRGGYEMALNLLVNNLQHSVDVEAETPLLWVLRDSLGLTGTKYGCGIGQCGACTVLIDGVAVRSCFLQARRGIARKVTTIRGLST